MICRIDAFDFPGEQRRFAGGSLQLRAALLQLGVDFRPL